jgi:undecaprenyl-diphosphatase
VNIIEAIILGLVQGVTEFVPVSSSGHLIIAHELLGVSEAGLTFDVALHLGTLLALCLFFYKDIKQLAVALVRKTDRSRLVWLLVLATVPAVIAGVLLEGLAESSFRSLRLVAFNLIAVGVLMIAAERYAKRINKPTVVHDTSRRQAIGMGLAQAVAIIPGVSRSGSTITAGLFGGMSREGAARFSFLLAIPITAGATLKVLISGDTLAQVNQESHIFLAGIITAFLSGLLAIRFLLRFVANHRLDVFAYYRFALGGIVMLLSFL